MVETARRKMNKLNVQQNRRKRESVHLRQADEKQEEVHTRNKKPWEGTKQINERTVIATVGQ